jgi:hypothetical protein
MTRLSHLHGALAAALVVLIAPTMFAQGVTVGRLTGNVFSYLCTSGLRSLDLITTSGPPPQAIVRVFR